MVAGSISVFVQITNILVSFSLKELSFPMVARKQTTTTS